jgi:hypothetical protein
MQEVNGGLTTVVEPMRMGGSTTPTSKPLMRMAKLIMNKMAVASLQRLGGLVRTIRLDTGCEEGNGTDGKSCTASPFLTMHSLVMARCQRGVVRMKQNSGNDNGCCPSLH